MRWLKSLELHDTRKKEFEYFKRTQKKNFPLNIKMLDETKYVLVEVEKSLNNVTEDKNSQINKSHLLFRENFIHYRQLFIFLLLSCQKTKY